MRSKLSPWLDPSSTAVQSIDMAEHPGVFFASEAEFPRWLEANHEIAPELLVGFWKKGEYDWQKKR